MYTWILVLTMFNNPDTSVISRQEWASKSSCIAAANEWVSHSRGINAVCIQQIKTQEQSVQRGSRTGKVGG